MRKSKILYVTIFTLVMFSACLAVWVYYLKEGKDLLNFTISIVGFCIALVALFIAVRTYTSIDSVNNISKMEGNILDNEHYVTSLPELVNLFKSKDEKILYSELFDSIDFKLAKESDTAVLFADTLQYMVDLIVLFPAIFNASKTDRARYKQRMDAILREVDRRRDILHAVSKGNSIQITETIKLFKAVVSYQNFVANDNFNIHADLLHVRGPILRNPVTKTVYHNYLGLYYNKKGMHLLRDTLNLGALDILSIEGLSLTQKMVAELSPAVIEEVTMYLKSACEQFDKALHISHEDLMWPGFINYNKARTLYFLSLLSDVDSKWLRVMDEAIEFRSRLNRLIDEILMVDRGTTTKIINTHLRQFFIYQEELARLVKLNLLLSERVQNNQDIAIIYKGTDLTNVAQQARGALFMKIDRFAKVIEYQQHIINHLNMACLS